MSEKPVDGCMTELSMIILRTLVNAV